MTFDAGFLRTRLKSMTLTAPSSRWLVAFSGGMDSTVLLHALSQCGDDLPQQVLAIHIDHGIHAESATWERHCAQIAATFGVDYLCKRVSVAAKGAGGMEAAARDARYSAFRNLVRDGDCLLSAHHADDQAETLLLNLLRGSGVAGIAGIGFSQPFAEGRLLRPLLDISRESLQHYAANQDLDWLDDPANDDTRFDRNFLRKSVMPLLATRWPAVATQFRKSADLAGEASELLNELADLDLASHEAADRLSIVALKALTPARQRNLLRRAVSICGLPSPPASRLYQAVNELIPAREDAQPYIQWNGAELRRYRDRLHIMANIPDIPDIAEQQAKLLLPDGHAVELMPGMGALRLKSAAATGIDPRLARDGIRIRYRQGGEEVRLAGHACTHKLKKLLQQDGILPWMRDRLPLLYAGDELVAIADLWIADGSAAQGGLEVLWDNRPTIR